ncbi:MAG: FliG C-terminal domain-containing protein [Polyangiaceae bacterium]
MTTNAEKAVLFLLSLDEQIAANVVRELGEVELRKLRAVASTMREVPAGALDDTFQDFLQRSASAVAVPRGGLPYLRRLSAGALGEQRAREIFEDGVTSPLARLEGAPSDAVAALLHREPPQLVAAVLARMDPAHAARILGAMPPERQTTVIRHVSAMTEIPAKVLEDVALALANELPTSDASTLVSVDGVAKAAELLNAAGRETSSAILAAIESDDGALALDVRQAMFTFDDLRRIDAKSMRELLRELPSERLTIALKGASPELTEAVFAGLSARAAELIRDDLEVLGRVKKSEIEAARREIVEAALRLESEGRVDLGRDGE